LLLLEVVLEAQLMAVEVVLVVIVLLLLVNRRVVGQVLKLQ
jgi:hypothetical protein